MEYNIFASSEEVIFSLKFALHKLQLNGCNMERLDQTSIQKTSVVCRLFYTTNSLFFWLFSFVIFEAREKED